MASLLAGAALAVLAAAPAGATIDLAGLSDQRAEMLTDPRVTGLGMRGARLVVRWDAAIADPGPVDRWLATSRAQGLEPLVVFNRTPADRCPSAPCVLPSVEEYAAAFRAFRQRWPWVTTFAPWNEANVRSQPPAGHPGRAAQFYNAMVAECPGCIVLGAELLDSTDAPAYLQAMLPAMASRPRAWGIHNYEDANHFRTSGTDPLIAIMPGEIWLTEAGGLVQYIDGRGRVTFQHDEQRAARALAFLFDYVEPRLDRIRRVYLYGWRSGGPRDAFDTALLRADGTERPAYFIAATRLSRLLAPPLPATTTRRLVPLQLLSRQIRAAPRGVLAGPFRCAVARSARCSGTLLLRRAGSRTPLAERRFMLAGRRTSWFTIPAGPRTRTALRRGRGGRLVLEARLTRPSRLTRSWGGLRVMRPRARADRATPPRRR